MNCLIYQNKAAVVQGITDRLSRGRTSGEKERLVKKLGQETDSLLTCIDYKNDSQDCKNCRSAALRHKNMMWEILRYIKQAGQ